MRATGPLFFASIAIGIGASETVLPLKVPQASFLAAAAALGAVRYPRAWPLVPLGLGFVRAAAARRQRARLVARGPLRMEGLFQTVGPEGRARVLEVAGRRLLLRDPPGELPPPGFCFRARAAARPFHGRAEPSAFHPAPWAAARGLHAEARLLGRLGQVAPAPGSAARLRRWAETFRLHARRRLGAGTGAPAALASALLLGDRSELTSGEREAFRHAGLAHLLALSGMHTGILALGLCSLLGSVRLRGYFALAALGAFLGGFAFLTGARAPIVRACATSLLAAAALIGGRRYAPLHALGLVGGALLLIRPATLHEAGFRLSFTAAALLGLVAGRSHPRRPRGRLGRAACGLTQAVALSALVTLGTLPEVLGTFGRASLLAPVTNLLAAPLAAALLGWGALAVLLPAPAALAEILARACRRAAQALLLLSRTAAQLPGGDLVLPGPTLPESAGVAVLAAMLAVGHRPRRPLSFALGALALLALGTRLPRDRITFVDVGQGDAVLLEWPAGAILVDGGTGGGREISPAERAVRWRRRGALQAVVVSHGDRDHAGGLVSILEHGATESLVAAPRAGQPPAPLRHLEELAAQRGVAVIHPEGLRAPRIWGAGRVQVASPWPGGDAPAGIAENDRSLTVHWKAGSMGAWLLGDLGRAGEESFLRSLGAAGARTPVLLAPHHGSRRSTSAALLARLRPSLVVISCGKDNAHGHPHAEVLRRLRRAGVCLLRTDRDGTVQLTVTARGFRVRWRRGFPGPRELFPAIPLPPRGAFP